MNALVVSVDPELYRSIRGASPRSECSRATNEDWREQLKELPHADEDYE